jgi:hypothetical protein
MGGKLEHFQPGCAGGKCGFSDRINDTPRHRLAFRPWLCAGNMAPPKRINDRSCAYEVRKTGFNTEKQLRTTGGHGGCKRQIGNHVRVAYSIVQRRWAFENGGVQRLGRFARSAILLSPWRSVALGSFSVLNSF